MTDMTARQAPFPDRKISTRRTLTLLCILA